MGDDLGEYYRKRAEEYEEIYHREDPIRQHEQDLITYSMQEALKDRDVLEVACGTGYWTQFLSETARSITATDIESKVMELARYKQYTCPISFELADAYHFPYDVQSFSGGLANMWFSHIPRKKLDAFLMNFHRVLKPHAHVFMCDNVFIPGIGGELITKEGDENTYKERKLKDGGTHLILKNYYSIQELSRIFHRHEPTFTAKNIFYGTCFWYISYSLS